MYYRAGKLLEERFGRKVLDALTIWGSTNNSSWLIYLGREGEYPLLLDDKGNPFLSWYLIGKALLSDSLAR
jgi:GH35 family endo-1,4-beta-xylanase